MSLHVSIAIADRFQAIESRLDRLEVARAHPLLSRHEIEHMRKHNRLLDTLMEPKYTFWLGAAA